MSVDAIAAKAEVSVQTLYTHFGSKRGLLLAVIDSIQQDVGLYADFDAVWSSRDGGTALRRMLEATFRLWHGAWPFISFTEQMRRTDDEIGRYLEEVDGYRRSNLRSITDRLSFERRLRPGLDAERAAELAFALSLPSVYEELAVRRARAFEEAMGLLVDAAVDAIVDASTAPATDPPADWSTVLRPASVGFDQDPSNGMAD
jgi:AcrR family transcriptional regulator